MALVLYEIRPGLQTPQANWKYTTALSYVLECDQVISAGQQGIPLPPVTWSDQMLS